MHKIIMTILMALCVTACGPHENDKTKAQTQGNHATHNVAFYNCGELGVKVLHKGQDELTLMALDDEYALPRVVSASGAKYETPKDSEPHIVFWSKGQQATLEIDGQSAPTCEQMVASTDEPDLYQGQGNEPFWRISMNKSEITLDVMDADKVTWPRPQAQKQNGLYVYPLSLSAQNPATLTIDPLPEDKPCQDSMSGQYYADAVRLEWNNQIFSGCGGMITEESQTQHVQKDTPQTKLELGQTEWLLEDINKTSIIDNAHLTLSFDEKEGRLYGFSGCNRYFGNYTIDGDVLKVHPALGATMMACVAEAMMNQERRYLDLLPTMTKAAMTPEGFLILSNDKDESLRFTAQQEDKAQDKLP